MLVCFPCKDHLNVIYIEENLNALKLKIVCGLNQLISSSIV